MILTSIIGALIALSAPPFSTTEPMVHDPVMAYEDGTYYLFATGENLQEMTSTDLKTWTVDPDGILQGKIPAWTHDSVPGFSNHVWAPDVINYGGKWYMAYSASTFGRNTSAIGLLSNDKLSNKSGWKDEGCIVASKGGRDDWNAIDPNFVLDEAGEPWLFYGSFWDGIQMVKLDNTMHIEKDSIPRTIARRFAFNPRWVSSENGGLAAETEPGKYSIEAGYDAIEAPFVFRHGGYYYLFVSWDYCCLGTKSSYRVVVGRSKSIYGPYYDDHGIDMMVGGGRPVIEGDKKKFQAAGHCAVYNFGKKDIFICHGYKVPNGEPVLILRDIEWKNGWPTLD